MSTSEPSHMRPADGRGAVRVLIAAEGTPGELEACRESVRGHTPPHSEILDVSCESASVNEALELVAPADVVILTEPCLVADGWLERLREAALADSNTASASALVDRGTPLAVGEQHASGGARNQGAGELARLAASVEAHTRCLRPYLNAAVGPCIYVRREALELVGGLDEDLELHSALELDFAQRCLLSGLAHVAADDVVVSRLAPARVAPDVPPGPLCERYPQLAGPWSLGASAVLALALEAARGPRRRLAVTLDARALDGAVTGTQVHILELIRALAATGRLQLRVLVRLERIDRETLALLRALPDTEILAAEELGEATAPSTVFHRPQQTFSAGDVALALSLGERLVVSQLDLIAYRNPGYFSDADAWEDYRRASRHGLTAAERVIVSSDHTRRELLADALVEEARIAVVPPGLDHAGASAPRAPSALARAQRPAPPDGFLLCLGTDFRHKNRLFALRLLRELRARHEWDGALVLAGTHIPRGSSQKLERDFLGEHPELSQAVIELGPVDEQEKAWLLAHAGAIAYPSVYEGFGLVPFESALAGVPCVFAPQSSLAEAAPPGTAAIVPWDEQASAAAAHALLTDPEARARHVDALSRAARELTWARAAEAIVAVYHEAALAPVRAAATLGRDLVAREGRLSVEHELEAAQLVREREHAQRMYDELNVQVGFALGLIGPNGSLPEGLQRALLALSAHPGVSRPLFAALARAFVLGRALARALRLTRSRA